MIHPYCQPLVVSFTRHRDREENILLAETMIRKKSWENAQ